MTGIAGLRLRSLVPAFSATLDNMQNWSLQGVVKGVNVSKLPFESPTPLAMYICLTGPANSDLSNLELRVEGPSGNWSGPGHCLGPGSMNEEGVSSDVVPWYGVKFTEPGLNWLVLVRCGDDGSGTVELGRAPLIVEVASVTPFGL